MFQGPFGSERLVRTAVAWHLKRLREKATVEIKSKTAYQQLPWYKRTLLWWRYRVPYMILAVITILGWILNGLPKMENIEPYGRWSVPAFIWSACKSIAHTKMGHTYTLDEIIGTLKEP